MLFNASTKIDFLKKEYLNITLHLLFVLYLLLVKLKNQLTKIMFKF